jgi:hypothetical protein
VKQTNPGKDTWPPDKAFALVQGGLLQGKSIGFLPTNVHLPTQQEMKKNGWGDDTRCVIDEWILLEYAATFLPVNQAALVEAVSKGAVEIPREILQALGQGVPTLKNDAPQTTPPNVTSLTPLSEIEKAVERAIASWSFDELANRQIGEAIDRVRGRV